MDAAQAATVITLFQPGRKGSAREPGASFFQPFIQNRFLTPREGSPLPSPSWHPGRGDTVPARGLCAAHREGEAGIRKGGRAGLLEEVASWPQSSHVEGFTHWVGFGGNFIKAPLSSEEGRGRLYFLTTGGVAIFPRWRFVSYSGVLQVF